MKQLCIDAHSILLPDVPMAGWDVALTNKGVLLLETNLSCNFFRGTFDEDLYFNMVDEYFGLLEGDATQVPLMKASTMHSIMIESKKSLHGHASRESFSTQMESGSSDAPSSDSESEQRETLVQRRTAP
eukprot:gnl/MRDRNA2_/MRDRNA2_117234_c0_seq1.p1 gnl/MRDRNA2_/MRDRNA2_117234_c0~~gnl/MRDRNA2_/MRDRNA2_117234_c0_seq1.p1  ORF type:complete len:129 (+),score=28.21 gnl/MRDRNA2_/MRDRNA2_117234_c0_seq1:2-388(+)